MNTTFYDDYDVDNIDLEEEMYLRDISEEEEDEEEIIDVNESSDSEDAENDETSSDIEKKHRKKGKTGRNISITENYLESQLKIKWENNRDELRFLYDNSVKYIGHVVHKISNGKYIFEVKILDDTENTKTLKALYLAKISKIK